MNGRPDEGDAGPSEGGSDVIRLFIALELPDEARAAIARLQDDLRRRTPPLRWVRPEAMHLTLRFIGAVERRQLSSIQRALTDAIEPFPPFALRTGKLGTFGGSRARVLWLGVEGELEGLHRLQRAADDALSRAGLPPPTRDRFAPHLTLARVPDRATPDERRTLRDVAAGPALPGVTFAIERIVLVQSEILPAGTRHTTLQRYPAFPK